MFINEGFIYNFNHKQRQGWVFFPNRGGDEVKPSPRPHPRLNLIPIHVPIPIGEEDFPHPGGDGIPCPLSPYPWHESWSWDWYVNEQCVCICLFIQLFFQWKTILWTWNREATTFNKNWLRLCKMLLTGPEAPKTVNCVCLFPALFNKNNEMKTREIFRKCSSPTSIPVAASTIYLGMVVWATKALNFLSAQCDLKLTSSFVSSPPDTGDWDHKRKQVELDKKTGLIKVSDWAMSPC